MIANTVTRYALYGKFKRERLLARPGRLLVLKGQDVSSQDAVAETDLSPEFLELEVAKWLNIPAGELDAFTERREGDNISENDIIAVGPAGLVQPTVRAPCTGRVLRIAEGKIILEKRGTARKLLAVYPGEVIDLIAERGVVIETTGALVQGVWGNGQMNSGRLRLILEKRDDPFNASCLTAECAGHVLVGGYCNQEEALRKAVEMEANGLVLSSMEARLVSVAAALPIPIVLVEGFGKMPYNETVYGLLTSLADRESILHAQALKRAEGFVPELIAPIPKDFGAVPFEWLVNEATSNDTAFMVSGGKVRIINAGTAESRVGRLVRILGQPQSLANGLRCMAAEVKLNDEELVVVPLANLDLLE